MKHLKTLSAQQFAIAACAALLSAGAMLSTGSKLAYLPLSIAIACGIGAFIKFKNR
jgi:hypothetical protein